jgi:hypothetical protein
MTEKPAATRLSPIEAPTQVASDLRRRIIGFGVWFVIGLAPLLGNFEVPLFTAVIAMYPADLQRWLIPLSGLLMGMIAIAVDYTVGAKKPSKALEKNVDWWFVRTLVVFLAAFVILIGLYVFTVTRVGHRTGPSREMIHSAIVTGTQQVPPQPPGSSCMCSPRQDAEQCINDISLNPAYIRTCFGNNRVALATVALALTYLAVMGSFVAAVGIGLVRHRLRRAV